MKNSKKIQLFALLLATSASFTACAGPTNGNSPASVKTNAQAGAQAKTEISQKPIKADIEKAKASGKAVFVVVTNKDAIGTDKAMKIAKEASSIYKKSSVVQMNRDIPANSEFVSQWGLSGAPLPIILCISPKGYATGGFILSEATAKKIAELVPSPKADEVYGAMNDKKSTIIIISKKSNTDKAKILANCKAAAKQLKDKAVIVEIDANDPKEAEFIKKMNLKVVPNATSVVVLNASGQTAGTFNGKVETTQIVTAAKKVVKSGCGSSCSPGGC